MTDKTEAQSKALRLAEELIEQAAHHRELAHCCDCRPEDTVNWNHYLQCGNAATELRRQHAEIEQLKVQLSARQAVPDDRLRTALERIIEWNRTHALDLCGDAERAEGWACVREAREALSAAPPTPEREPLTDEQIIQWWASENGLEDCDMAVREDFVSVVHAVQARLGFTTQNRSHQ